MPSVFCLEKCSKLLVFSILFLLVGCPKGMMTHRHSKVTPDFLKRFFEKEQKHRYQISGTFSARSIGLKRMLGSIQVDAVAQAPSSLYMSVRSFFNQPARTLATDGTKVHLLETSGSGEPQYFVHSANREDIEEIILLPLTAGEVVEVVLGIVSLKKKNIVSIEEDLSRGVGKIVYEDRDHRITTLEVSLSDFAVLSRKQTDRTGSHIYTVTYKRFRKVGEVNFAHQWDFEVHFKNKSYGVTLKTRDVKFNGELFEKDTFHIEPV